MSLGTVCGLWPGARGLVAAIVDVDGSLVHAAGLPHVEDDEENALWLSRAEAEYGPGLELVLTARVARHEPVSRLAVAMGHRVWVAPADFVGLVAAAAWWRPTPRQLAAMLARLPRIRAARALLRRMPLDPGPRQLRLFY